MLQFFHLVPTRPLNVIVVPFGISTALIVMWKPPSRSGSTITTYMVTYNNITIDIGGNYTSYTITGLDPYVIYSITVIACNDIGCSSQSDTVIGTTEEGLCVL